MAEPVTHYFARNTSKTVYRQGYRGAGTRTKFTKAICGRLLHDHNSRYATKDKDEVTCKKCLTHRL